MPHATVRRTAAPVPLAGTPWAGARALEIAQYPWYEQGTKQRTTVRLLHDDAALYLQFLCDDAHIFSQVTEFNGAVFEDSCVEFFAMPQPEAGRDYLNLEINCCGVMHLGVGGGREGRRLADPPLAERFTIVTSVPGPMKDESPSDNGWWAAVKLPFDALDAFTGLDTRPSEGALWRANFHRCGGRTDPQHACWSLIARPQPDFHRPESFGELRFGA